VATTATDLRCFAHDARIGVDRDARADDFLQGHRNAVLSTTLKGVLANRAGNAVLATRAALFVASTRLDRAVLRTVLSAWSFAAPVTPTMTPVPPPIWLCGRRT